MDDRTLLRALMGATLLLLAVNLLMVREFRGVQQAYQARVAEGVPARASVGYGPALGKWGENGIEASEPYSGEATINLLNKYAALPQKVALDIGESEGFRKATREQYLRDLNLKNEGVISGYRGDLQNTRRFLAEADWPKAVELIRKGLSPAAAIAALGYSASAMAQDNQ